METLLPAVSDTPVQQSDRIFSFSGDGNILRLKMKLLSCASALTNSEERQKEWVLVWLALTGEKLVETIWVKMTSSDLYIYCLSFVTLKFYV